MAQISLIAAIGKHNELGSNNELLWHIPEDFNWFKWHTHNKVCVMGRKTYESIGKPLKNRINIVLTRDENYNPHPHVIVRNDISEILFEFQNEKEVMILGGSEIYRQFLPYANRLYLTKVDREFTNADSYFPEIEWNDWTEYFMRPKVEDHELDYNFHVYKKPLK